MRISVRGWSRDLGETNLVSGDLEKAETLGEGGRYSVGKLYKEVKNPQDWRGTKVRISTSTEVRLGGTYLLQLELSRREIAELFFETHTGSMVRMLRAFINEEHREDYARDLARIAEIEQRRRTRMIEQESGDA